jgi:hypothetical protein
MSADGQLRWNNGHPRLFQSDAAGSLRKRDSVSHPILASKQLHIPPKGNRGCWSHHLIGDVRMVRSTGSSEARSMRELMGFISCALENKD